MPQTFIATGSDLAPLQRAARSLRAANRALAAAKKEADSCKQQIKDWLLKERKVDVERLPIGETVLIDKIVLVTIGQQKKLDAEALKLKEAELYETFVRPFPTVGFMPLAD